MIYDFLKLNKIKTADTIRKGKPTSRTQSGRGRHRWEINMRTRVLASKCSRNSLVWFTEIAAVNKEMHMDILRRPRDAVRRKSPDRCRTSSLFLLHDNAPAHRSVGSRISQQRTVWQHCSIPWPGSSQFLSVPSTEINIEGSATDIIKNATEELKRLPKNGFQQCFEHLHSRWQKCI